MSDATSSLQQQVIAQTTDNWSQTVTFAPFDPALGTLVNVQIGVTAQVTGTVSLDNLGTSGGSETVSLPGTVSVFDPNGAEIASVEATASGSATLGAFDGYDNYAGSSGTTLTDLSATQSVQDLYNATSELALFTGHDPVPLMVDASVLFGETGLGNLQTLSHASAAAVVTLQYDYIPVADSTSGSGDDGADFTFLVNAPLVGVFSAPDTTIVTTAPQTFTIAAATTGWTNDLSVAQFNPNLGTLASVNITLTGNEDASVFVENLDASAASVGVTETATLTLATPDPTTDLTAAPSLTDSMSLTGFDGTEDFGGTSGRTDQGLTASSLNAIELTSATDLAAFTGTGTMTLPLSAVGAASLSGPGDLLTQLLDQAGATVAISYTYYANASSEAPAFIEFDGDACFAAGTRIATDYGEIAIEELRVGDRVLTVLGGAAVPVIWAGRRKVDCARHPQPRKVWPVRVAAGAFGPGRPHRDLFLSPDHALYVCEVLIPVKHLINGSTIAQVPVAQVTYHHVELAAHDVLLAEGLPAESFLDMRDGTAYMNRPGPARLYSDFSARVWEAFGCAPLIVTGPELAAARALVAKFAAGQQAA